MSASPTCYRLLHSTGLLNCKSGVVVWRERDILRFRVLGMTISIMFCIFVFIFFEIRALEVPLPIYEHWIESNNESQTREGERKLFDSRPKRRNKYQPANEFLNVGTVSLKMFRRYMNKLNLRLENLRPAENDVHSVGGKGLPRKFLRACSDKVVDGQLVGTMDPSQSIRTAIVKVKALPTGDFIGQDAYNSPLIFHKSTAEDYANSNQMWYISAIKQQKYTKFMKVKFEATPDGNIYACTAQCKYIVGGSSLNAKEVNKEYLDGKEQKVAECQRCAGYGINDLTVQLTGQLANVKTASSGISGMLSSGLSIISSALNISAPLSNGVSSQVVDNNEVIPYINSSKETPSPTPTFNIQFMKENDKLSDS